jgi:hypothetical protein
MNTLIAFVVISSSLIGAVAPAPTSTIDCQIHYMEGFELPGWVTNDTWYREMPQYTVGRAVWYAPHLMNSTALMRDMDLEGFAGGIATNSAGMMGKVAWLKRPNHSWEGPFLIVDVGQRNHAYHQAINVKSIVEVDFETALRWGITSGSTSSYRINKWFEPDVEMWVGLQPPPAGIGNPTNYEKWYAANAEFCDGLPNRRWKLEDWMITDYDEYASRLNGEGGGMSAQLEIDAIHNAVIIQDYLASLPSPDLSKEPERSLPQYETPEAETASEPSALTIHTLKSHETWTHLALIYYGEMSEPYWRHIYEANIELVGEDYRRIWGGMEIVIPALPSNLVP